MEAHADLLRSNLALSEVRLVVSQLIDSLHRECQTLETSEVDRSQRLAAISSEFSRLEVIEEAITLATPEKATDQT